MFQLKYLICILVNKIQMYEIYYLLHFTVSELLWNWGM